MGTASDARTRTRWASFGFRLCGLPAFFLTTANKSHANSGGGGGLGLRVWINQYHLWVAPGMGPRGRLTQRAKDLSSGFDQEAGWRRTLGNEAREARLRRTSAVEVRFLHFGRPKSNKSPCNASNPMNFPPASGFRGKRGRTSLFELG